MPARSWALQRRPAGDRGGEHETRPGDFLPPNRLPAAIEIDSALREALAQSDPSALVSAEYLDVPSFYTENYHSALMAFLHKSTRKSPQM